MDVTENTIFFQEPLDRLDRLAMKAISELSLLRGRMRQLEAQLGAWQQTLRTVDSSMDLASLHVPPDSVLDGYPTPDQIKAAIAELLDGRRREPELISHVRLLGLNLF